MDWSSVCPDLNPVGHLWGTPKWIVEKSKISNMHQLHDGVLEGESGPVVTCEAPVKSTTIRELKNNVVTKNINILGIFGHFHLGVYSLVLPVVYTKMALC